MERGARPAGHTRALDESCAWGRKGHLHQQLWMERRRKPFGIICRRWIYLSTVFWGLIIFITMSALPTALRYQLDIKWVLPSRCPSCQRFEEQNILSVTHGRCRESPKSPCHKFPLSSSFVCTLRSLWPLDDFRILLSLNSHFLLLSSS